ncbi:hypothetical protein AOLI_G00330550 [Acnodon oligacanthus]
MAAARAQRAEENSRSPASSSSSVSGPMPLRAEPPSHITGKWRSVQFQLQLIAVSPRLPAAQSHHTNTELTQQLLRSSRRTSANGPLSGPVESPQYVPQRFYSGSALRSVRSSTVETQQQQRTGAEQGLREGGRAGGARADQAPPTKSFR